MEILITIQNRARGLKRPGWKLVAVALAILHLWGACVFSSGAADAPALSEYQVKALFLFNFAKYVDWPPQAFATGTAPIVIGVVGTDNFGDSFKQVIAGKTVNGRAVVIKQVTDEPGYQACHILFVSVSEKGRIAEILSAVKDTAVLTVGETDQFLTQNGMINLRKKDNKIRLEINLGGAQRANLKLSSKLLGVADTVVNKPEIPKG